jgi:FKBP-type peptidyl-prolyl cis-trans isomerase
MPKDKQARVKIEYTGYLADGTVFDTSKGKPTQTARPVGGFVKGFTEGLSTMHVGGKRKLVIPSELGYQLRQQGKIPAGSTLIFDVELLEVLPPTTRPSVRRGTPRPVTKPAGHPR